MTRWAQGWQASFSIGFATVTVLRVFGKVYNLNGAEWSVWIRIR